MEADRRGWMGLVVRCSLGLATAGGGLASLLFIWPGRVRDLSRQIRLSRAASLPRGSSRYLPDPRVFVLHEPQGLCAIHGRCTHLGCGLLRHSEGFSCPCHGARFDRLGQPLSGPATRPLSWLRLGSDPGGDLVLYLDERVEPGAWMQV